MNVRKTIEQVLSEKTSQWISIPGVAGIAAGTFKGKPCIKILTTLNPREVKKKIPATVEDYPVIFEKTGPFRALGLK